MKKSLLLAMLLCTFCVDHARAQDSTAVEPDYDSSEIIKPVVKAFGKFNYTFVRVGYLFPSKGFNNPISEVPAASGNFSNQGAMPYMFRLGFESGKVRHFNKLNLGTPMLKLGINSGKISTEGVYLIRLGLGPQLTFKPIEDLRIGVYYRANVAVCYSSYKNDETTTPAPETTRTDELKAYMINFIYEGDLGIDLSWHAICVGVSYSMMHVRPSKGALVSAQKLGTDFDTYKVTTQTGSDDPIEAVTPIDPKIKLNHLTVSVGFAL
jgi:hypothetical protein